MSDMQNGQQLDSNQAKGLTNGAPLFLTSEAAQRQQKDLTTNLSYEITEMDTGGIIDFSTHSGLQAPVGNAPQLVTGDYIDALVASLDDTFNGDDWKAALQETGINVEFRPAKTQATPITIHQIKDKTVSFDNTKRVISAATAPAGSVGTGTLVAGQALHLKPAKQAVQFSATTQINDFDISTSGFTHGSLMTAVTQYCEDMNNSMCDAIVSVLSTSDAVKTINTDDLTSTKPADISDEVLDYVALNLMATGFSESMDEVALILPKHFFVMLSRLAQRNGFTDVHEMLGCTAMSYSAAAPDLKKGDVYILPKRLVGLSFRSAKDGSGDVVKVIATRVPSRQATVIETIGAVDILCEGWTQVQDKGDAIPVQLKHIVKLVIGGNTTAP